jgi:hypothetical protein
MQVTVTFSVSATTNFAALSNALAALGAVAAPVKVAHKPDDVPVVVEPTSPSTLPSLALVTPEPTAVEPAKKRGRPRKDAPATPVQGVPAEAAHAATPPAAKPVAAAVVGSTAPTAAPAKTEDAIAAELFGDVPKPAAPAGKPATLEELQEAMRAFITKKGAKAAQTLFNERGFAVLSAVPAERYREMVDALTL